jgi:hypothetical protein
MTFCYDLSEELCTFDFFGWLVQAQAEGATEIAFDVRWFRPSIYSGQQLWERYTSILAPGPALAGLPSRQGTDGIKLPIGSSRMGRLVALSRQRRFRPLSSVLRPGVARYTVTLRHQQKAKYRNSNEAAWRQFAQEIGATVIPDYDDEPMHLHERVALYAGAEMNFGIMSGPMTLCSLTEYPCMIFACGRGKEGIQMDKYGVPRGSQLPWMTPNQFSLWGDDDLVTLRQTFKEWKNGSLSRHH